MDRQRNVWNHLVDWIFKINSYRVLSLSFQEQFNFLGRRLMNCATYDLSVMFGHSTLIMEPRSRYSSVASLLTSPTGDFEPENSLLVANRGEIAIRVVRAGHQLGHKTITIYSPEDSLSMHRYVANESYQIGEKGEFTPVGAYLAIDRIINIAKHRRVTVIHPGNLS